MMYKGKQKLKGIKTKGRKEGEIKSEGIVEMEDWIKRRMIERKSEIGQEGKIE